MHRIRQLEKDRALKKLETFKEVYSKIVKETVKKAELNQNICIYHIPDTIIDIDTALPWIVKELRKEGYQVESLENVEIDTGPQYTHREGTKHDIFIYWKKKNIDEYDSMVQLDEEIDITNSVFLNQDRLMR